MAIRGTDLLEDLGARRLLLTLVGSISASTTSNTSTLHDLRPLLSNRHMVLKEGVIAPRHEMAVDTAQDLHHMQPGPRLPRSSTVIKPTCHTPSREQ